MRMNRIMRIVVWLLIISLLLSTLLIGIGWVFE
ncbi:stressosome-associated protein Prli42 [Paenibacillus spongiae]|uniref:Stressosome-associated protein Prli42 n=1 Tax=Paenibacillus spongiae TaxID=2909671 RepID=A0ABY5SFJ6_9BACL|nr:stressosome-associated protein Prli42 [Paenibacillus spongiae]UVI32318.1 stressosome-associated protein Prli42 [Paenibacillus spongiae]